MDRITDVTPEFATGIGYALMTVFFAAPPLALLGMALVHRLTRGTPSPLPFPDALHALARFALVLIALHAAIVLPTTAFFSLAAYGDDHTRPLSLILAVVPVVIGLVEAKGLQAWTHIFHHAAQTRPVSLWNEPLRIST